MAATGWLAAPPSWDPSPDRNGDKLAVSVTYGARIWPWAGWLSLRIAAADDAAGFVGVAEGIISFTVVSPQHDGGDGHEQKSTVLLPIRVKVIAAPPRRRRLLWDVFHSIACVLCMMLSLFLTRMRVAVCGLPSADPMYWHAGHGGVTSSPTPIHRYPSGFFPRDNLRVSTHLVALFFQRYLLPALRES